MNVFCYWRLAFFLFQHLIFVSHCESTTVLDLKLMFINFCKMHMDNYRLKQWFLLPFLRIPSIERIFLEIFGKHVGIKLPDTSSKPTKHFFSKCEQRRRKLRICLHLLEKSFSENFIFCAVFNPSKINSGHTLLKTFNWFSLQINGLSSIRW